MQNESTLKEAHRAEDGAHQKNGSSGVSHAERVVFISTIADQALFAGMFSVWRQQGYLLEIWTEMTGLEYRNARSFMGRLRMRIRFNVMFPLRVSMRLLFGSRYGCRTLIVTSTPFFMATIVSFLRRPSDSLCQMLCDLYPDALVVAGKFGARSIQSAFIGRVVGAGMRRCDMTVFPGERLREYAETQYGPCPYSITIPVGADSCQLKFDGDRRQNELISVVYVGNFGYLHDYRTLSNLLRSGLPHGIKIAFFSSGNNYERFKAESPFWPEGTRARISFNGPLGNEQWLQVMKAADVGLVLFVNGAEKVAFPSKAFSAMGAGQAILAVAPFASDLSDVIRFHDCGWIAEPGDVAGLRTCIEEIIRDRDALRRKQTAAAAAAEREYDVAQVALRWTVVFERLRSKAKQSEPEGNN